MPRGGSAEVRGGVAEAPRRSTEAPLADTSRRPRGGPLQSPSWEAPFCPLGAPWSLAQGPFAGPPAEPLSCPSPLERAPPTAGDVGQALRDAVLRVDTPGEPVTHEARIAWAAQALAFLSQHQDEVAPHALSRAHPRFWLSYSFMAWSMGRSCLET